MSVRKNSWLCTKENILKVGSVRTENDFLSVYLTFELWSELYDCFVPQKKKKTCDLSFPLKRILFCIDQLEVCPFLKTILINPKHLPQEF